MASSSVPYTTSISVKPGYRPSQLPANVIGNRIDRAVYPLSGKITIAFQLRPDRVAYLTLAEWRVQAGGPAGVRALRRYLAECLKRADGMIAEEGPAADQVPVRF